MRPALPAKASTTDLHSAKAVSPWPGDSSALRQAPIETALQIQFHGVENLIRALDDITWVSRARGRRRR
ncbi:MAG TPA: hypothetical protein VHC97_03980 [Thermoanaerobaculia bacterium]|jgi:hypothetical protein|nr:hypothetical protein [Thermoanaerobaculia bacterium]